MNKIQEVESKQKLIRVFSLLTGQVTQIESDEVKTMDEWQVPLKKEFPYSCKKCNGRGYIGYHSIPGEPEEDKQLVPCPSCMRKCVDEELARALMEEKLGGLAGPFDPEQLAPVANEEVK